MPGWVKWILIILAVILWIVMFVGSIYLIVILLNVKKRIDDGNNEDSIKYSEVTFGLVIAFFLFFGLLGIAFWVIYLYWTRNNRANDLKKRFDNVIQGSADGSATAVQKIIYKNLENVMDISKREFNQGASDILSIVTNSLNDVKYQVTQSNCENANELNAFIDSKKQNIETSLNTINRDVQMFRLNDNQRSRIIIPIIEASRMGAIQGGSAIASTVIQASDSGKSTAEAAAVAAPTAVLAGSSVGDMLSGDSSSGWFDRFKGFFSRSPSMPCPPVPTLLAEGINVGSRPEFKCNDGSNPPCGSYTDFKANLYAAPNRGWPMWS